MKLPLVAVLSSFLLCATPFVASSRAASLVDIESQADLSAFRAKGTAISLAGAPGARAIQAVFGAATSFPNVEFPVPSGGLDLSAYAGIEVEVTNVSGPALTLCLRADNAGDWKQSPWNTSTQKIAAGETRTVRLTFGRNNDQPGFALDTAHISAVQLFLVKPKQETTFLIRSLKTWGTPKDREAAASATSSAKPAATGTENLNAPSIGGEILDLDSGKVALASIKTQGAAVTFSGAAGARSIQAVFGTGTGYPAVVFPVPAGGWNLSAFAGVQVEVTHAGGPAVTVILRADNPGDWKQAPWNTSSVRIAPGETKIIKLTFGRNNDQPGFALDSTRVSNIQAFIAKPAQDTTLRFRDLKAWGSPEAGATAAAAFSTPADREKPVTPPVWLGQRPPVEGDWVQSFEDNFDGIAVNEKLWNLSKSSYSKLYIYQPANVSVKDGTLLLNARQAAVEGRQYTSGQIEGFGKWAQLYGYFETRVKLPATRGFWPAFWLMPDRDINGSTEQQSIWERNSTKKGGMEFDILEHLSEWGPGRHNVALHWDGYTADHKQWGDTHVYYGPTPDGWHAFGMLWEPGKVTWFVDGIKKQEWINERVGSVPGHLLLSLQMGGWATKDIDFSKIDQPFEVDWVRVWQLKERLK